MQIKLSSPGAWLRLTDWLLKLPSWQTGKLTKLWQIAPMANCPHFELDMQLKFVVLGHSSDAAAHVRSPIPGAIVRHFGGLSSRTLLIVEQLSSGVVIVPSHNQRCK